MMFASVSICQFTAAPGDGNLALVMRPFGPWTLAR